MPIALSLDRRLEVLRAFRGSQNTLLPFVTPDHEPYRGMTASTRVAVKGGISRTIRRLLV